MTMSLRTDRDSLGSIDLPAEALFGTGSARGRDNFAHLGAPIRCYPHFVSAMALVKKAAAKANLRCGALDPDVGDAIVKACDEIHAGHHHENFVVTMAEGSGGTSTNMNFNEVIANRAGQLLGSKVGSYDRVHPNDHVNRSQSTNDVFPTAVKLACYLQAARLLEVLDALSKSFCERARTFSGVLRLGRTCMQAAQPMTYDQLFGGYASGIERGMANLGKRREDLCVVPMGATAIGTGLGAAPGYRQVIAEELTAAFGFGVQLSPDHFDGMQNADGFARFSDELRVVADIIGKIGADLVVLSSGRNSGLGELKLPAVQPGSSIMPGKVNPVMPMTVQQLAFAVHGYNATVSVAVLNGHLEINHFEPIIAKALFEAIEMMTAGYAHFCERCIAGIEVDKEASYENLANSAAISSVFLRSMGYGQVTDLVKRAEREGRPFVQIAKEEGLLSEAQITEGLHQAALGKDAASALK